LELPSSFADEADREIILAAALVRTIVCLLLLRITTRTHKLFLIYDPSRPIFHFATQLHFLPLHHKPHCASASTTHREASLPAYHNPHHQPPRKHLFPRTPLQLTTAFHVARITRLTSNLARIKTIKKPSSAMPPKRAAAATKAAAKDAPAAAAKNKANTAAKVTKPVPATKKTTAKSKAAEKAPAKARGRPKKQAAAEVEAEPEAEAESGSEADSEEEKAEAEAEKMPKATKTKANGEHIPLCVFPMNMLHRIRIVQQNTLQQHRKDGRFERKPATAWVL
jgi:hypothetical protein